ncbi:DsbC family protein [Novosphingobium sp. G106]|uniref:DsbC family protein n=1 Tax=Novosphingobium sp. G106 TaxID=2849500 RepID=UPI001C2DD9C4|nr:DsbC family protein [Novosphingobium sp. G106]MBV1692706.1 DsbC family protein [Novosphingobium sp. G106]
MNWRIAGLAALIAATASVAVLAASPVDGARVGQLLKARLPKTKVSAVDCSKIEGLCEVVAGKTLFYTDAGARYLFVGRLYDMETRQDLTAAKLLEINPDMLLGGAAASVQVGAQSAGREESEAPQLTREAKARPTVPAKVDLAGLGNSGAIVWGKPAGRTVTIFTDFRCGYCRALASTLEQMDVRVIERPISVLGSRDLANRVYCARDKARAVRAAYAGETLPGASCDTSGLDANERFAREKGFTGTPVIVRDDGAVLEGFRPRDFLEQWIKGGS